MIGRNPKNDLAIPQDEQISGKPRRIFATRKAVSLLSIETLVTALSSTETNWRVLTSGDRVRIGNSTLQVRMP